MRLERDTVGMGDGPALPSTVGTAPGAPTSWTPAPSSGQPRTSWAMCRERAASVGHSRATVAARLTPMERWRLLLSSTAMRESMPSSGSPTSSTRPASVSASSPSTATMPART